LALFGVISVFLKVGPPIAIYPAQDSFLSNTLFAQWFLLENIMNAANRPIDFLLNTESVKVAASPRREIGAETTRDSGVTDSKTREKSFDDVYRQQRRDDAVERQNSLSARRNENQARGEDRADAGRQKSQVAGHSDEDKRPQKSVQGIANGKELPPEQALTAANENSALKTEQAIDAESMVVALENDVEVTVSFDAQLSESQPLHQPKPGQIESDLLDSLPKEAAPLLADDSALEEQTIDGLDTVVQVSTEAEQELIPSTDEAINLQAGQVAHEQQAKVTVADVAKEFKQSILSDVVGGGGNNSANAAVVNKPGTMGAEQAAQVQLPERVVAAAPGQEFKLLREQFSVANFSVSADKTAAVDAPASADSAADRLPRLNALTQSAQALGLARPGTVTASVQAPVTSPDWGQAMSQRIMWLVNRGISAAELQLNPRDLGPVDVRINVNGEQTSVQFTSQHAAVREALESSVVRLREMMESSGLDLADVNVSDQSPSEQAQSDSSRSSDTASTDGSDEPDEGLETQTVQRMESDGLVDFYA